MNILLLSPFFYPEQISTGKYNTSLAEALASEGHDVTVLASHPIYPNWRVEVSNESLSNINIKRGGLWLLYPHSPLLRRAVLELWFASYVMTSYFNFKERPDIVIPIFPPSLFFMALNTLLPRTIKRIGIVHDLQGIYAARSTGGVKKILNAAIHFVEEKCFKGCDRLIFLSKSMMNSAVVEYKLNSEKCIVNYPFVSIGERQIKTDALHNLLKSESFNVVYSGALGEKQNPEELFKFLNQIALNDTNISSYIFSSGPIFNKLKFAHQDSINNKVQFHELVPVEQLTELYARSDVQIIPQANDTSDGSLPSKLPNLLAAGVPVFVICDHGSELGDLVKESNAGEVANTWNINELVEVFNSYKARQESESKHERRNRLQMFVKEKFSLSRVVDSILT